MGKHGHSGIEDNANISCIYLVSCMSVPKRSAGVKIVLDYTLKYTALELARL